MTLTQYQAAAAATAMPKAYHHNYLVPMIVGETGELLGHIAKGYWHEKSAEALQIELVSEFGDICWGTAILLSVEGVNECKAPEIWVRSQFRSDVTQEEALLRLLRRAGYLYMFHTDGQNSHFIKDEAVQLWWALETFCKTITGHDFEYVLQRNLQKLADRAARGVLKGSGDHR